MTKKKRITISLDNAHYHLLHDHLGDLLSFFVEDENGGMFKWLLASTFSQVISYAIENAFLDFSNKDALSNFLGQK